MANYSLAQVELFLEAVDKVEREQMRNQLIVARAAKAKPDQFKKLLKDLG